MRAFVGMATATMLIGSAAAFAQGERGGFDGCVAGKIAVYDDGVSDAFTIAKVLTRDCRRFISAYAESVAAQPGSPLDANGKRDLMANLSKESETIAAGYVLSERAKKRQASAR